MSELSQLRKKVRREFVSDLPYRLAPGDGSVQCGINAVCFDGDRKRGSSHL